VGEIDAVWIDNHYGRMRAVVGKFAYSPEDVQIFSLALGAHQGGKLFPLKAGLFLSALANGSKVDGATINISHYEEPVSYLGYRNKKKIIVKGDTGLMTGSNMFGGEMVIEGNAGWRLGFEMRGGSIIVKGDVDNDVGDRMENGSISVKGNARDFVGAHMKGGEVIIEGNARGLGYHMRGGSISINGDFEFISTDQMLGGKIFQKGKLIFEK